MINRNLSNFVLISIDKFLIVEVILPIFLNFFPFPMFPLEICSSKNNANIVFGFFVSAFQKFLKNYLSKYSTAC